MNDPHVVSLRYRLKTDESTSYNAPPAVTWDTNVFKATLEDDVLLLEMKEHHATVGSAVAAVGDSLRSWELDVALRSGRGALRFEYQDAEVMDRNPPPPGSPQVINEQAAAGVVVGCSVSNDIAKARYPDPPQRFKTSSLVETMWKRFEQFLDGKEPLTGMAYFCVTVIEADAGDRGRAAKKYNIDPKVLSELGRLTSAVGDGETGRKYVKTGSGRPHTEKEKAWIQAAIKMLIRRVGEYEADPAAPLQQISMSDLPSL